MEDENEAAKRIPELTKCLSISDFILFSMKCGYEYEGVMYMIYMCSNFRIRNMNENLDEEGLLYVELTAIFKELVLNGGVSKAVLLKYRNM